MDRPILTEFTSVTGCKPEDAHVILKTHEWNLTAALGAYFDNPLLSEEILNATKEKELAEEGAASEIVYKGVEPTGTTFCLPDFTGYDVNYRKYLEQQLIEKSTMNVLEQGNRLNWWWLRQYPNTQRIWVVTTNGDGNCLLHATSISMWGYHDVDLKLRKLLHMYFLSGNNIKALKRRWRWQQMLLNAASSLRYSQQEWEEEWCQVVSLSSTKKRRQTPKVTYESLEDIHILILSTILCRPIIVIAETMLLGTDNKPFSPNTLGGIYMPFDCPSTVTTPLILAFNSSHFSAVVFMESEKFESYHIPLVDTEGKLLPIKFDVDPGLNFDWENFELSELRLSPLTENDNLSILREYLDVVDMPGNDSPDGGSQEDINRRFIVNCDENGSNHSNKSNASKQLGKHVGNMRKTLKHRLNSLTRLTKLKKDATAHKLLKAEISIVPVEHHKAMTDNFLAFIAHKYFTTKIIKQTVSGQTEAKRENSISCINEYCTGYGTFETSYFCDKCYKIQKSKELSHNRCKKKNAQFYVDLGQSTSTIDTKMSNCRLNTEPGTNLAMNYNYLIDSNILTEKEALISPLNQPDKNDNISVDTETPKRSTSLPSISESGDTICGSETGSGDSLETNF